MNEREFCYWLQGLLEVGDPKKLNEKQVAIIKEHLALVFTKVTSTPDVSVPTVWPVMPTQPQDWSITCSTVDCAPVEDKKIPAEMVDKLRQTTSQGFTSGQLGSTKFC